MKNIAKYAIITCAACLAIVGCAKKEPPKTEPTTEPAPAAEPAPAEPEE